MPTYRRIIAVLLQVLALAFAVPAAQAEPTHIAASLVAEGPAAPGGTTTLAFVMKPEAGWHGYWVNPGDAGLGMRLEWMLPKGASAGELRYPVPQTLLISGLMNHVFEHDYALMVLLTLSPDSVPGSRVPVRVKASWLACTEQLCVPESAELETSALVGSGVRDPRFDAWRAALPAPLDAKSIFAIDAKTVRIGIPLPKSLALSGPHLFPETEHLIAYAAPQEFRRNGDMLVVTLKRPEIAAATPTEVKGVLRLNGNGDGVEFTASPGTVPTGGELIADPAAKPPLSLPLLLLAALAGGLLLNIMPCVFPILSLKALSLARAGESEAEARAEGLAYTAGVVLACAILGAVLLALRAAGQEVGWAFQLQEPAVVVALLLLAVTITANLAGLFEFAIPGFAGAANPKSAFATGLLAAFVATPCTGPFMAAAMGAALLLPVAEGMALFVALGLGIALPFLAVAYVPALRRLLPKPGMWMVWFKKLMAVPMALTACALLWLCWRLGGNWFAFGCALSALFVIVALWEIGSRQQKGRPTRRAIFSSLLILGVFCWGKLERLYEPPTPGAIESILPSQPFSEEALAKARASGKPVFVYFTADWCLTCKVNESAAIEREEVKKAFEKAGVQVLVGDWTRRDPAITRFLTAQGAAGVPLYLWYAPGKDAEQLPQVLSAGLLAGKAQ